MSTPPVPDEERELRLLDKAEFKFALANTDDKLNSLLDTYICPIIIKLNSPHETVRNKVKSILHHLDVRTSSNSQIHLPSQKLADLVIKTENSDETKLFAVRFLNLEIEKEDVSHELLLEPLLDCLTISELSSVYYQSLWNCFVVSIVNWSNCSPKRSISLLKFPTQAFDLILQYQLYTLPVKRSNSLTNTTDLVPTFNGISSTFAQKVQPPDNESLKYSQNISVDKAKIACFDLIFTEAQFNPSLKWTIAIVAKTDINPELRSIAETSLNKEIGGKIDNEDFQFIFQMTRLCVRSDSLFPTLTKEAVRIQALSILAKSLLFVQKLEFIDVHYKLINEQLDTPAPSPKSLCVIAQLAIWVATKTEASALQNYADNLLLCLFSQFRKISDNPDFYAQPLPLFVQALALIIQNCPNVLNADFHLIDELFALYQSRTNRILREAIDDAMPSITIAFQRNASAQHYLLRCIAERAQNLRYSHEQEPNINFIRLLLKLMSSVFPFSNSKARHICLMLLSMRANNTLIGDNDDSSNLVNPFGFYQLNICYEGEKVKGSQIYPKFEEMIENFKKEPVYTFEYLETLYCSLIANALSSLNLDINFDSMYHNGLINQLRSNSDLQKSVSDYLKAIEFRDYCSILNNFIVKNVKNSCAFARDFFRIVPLSQYIDLFDEAKQFLHNSIWTRSDLEDSIPFYSLLLSKSSDEDFNTIYTNITNQLQISEVAISDFKYRSLWLLWANMTVKKGVHVKYASDCIQNLIKSLKVIDSRKLLVLFQVIEILCKYGFLRKINEFDKAFAEDLIKQINQIPTKSVGFKYALSALSSLTINEPGLSSIVLDFLYDTMEKGDNSIETLLSVGDAICVVCLGWKARCIAATNDDAEVIVPHGFDSEKELTEQLVSTISVRFAQNPRPIMSKVTLVLLFSILENSSNNEIILRKHQLYVPILVKALVLSDSAGQELASKGLNRLYRQLEPNSRSELTSSLMKYFTNDQVVKELKTEFMLDTETSSEFTTLKKLCKIAQESGKPEMIYQLMAVVNHSIIYKTKEAISASLIDNSEAQKFNISSQEAAKIYLFQFDPDSAVASSMSKLSNIIDMQKLFSEGLPILFKQIADNLSSLIWRQRETGCRALCEVIRGVSKIEINDTTILLTRLLFRLLDDLKDSVRVAAIEACNSFKKGICSKSTGSNTQTFSRLLEILLESLQSTVKEVRYMAVEFLIEISKSQHKKILVNDIPKLTVPLLYGISETESQQINYASQYHAQAFGLSQEKIDSSRALYSKTSPHMKLLQDLVVVASTDSLNDTCKEILKLLENSVPFPTKIAYSHLLTFICLRRASALAPEAAKFSELLTKLYFKESNTTVLKAYSDTIGSIAQLLECSEVLKLFRAINEYYQKHDRPDHKIIISWLLDALLTKSHGMIQRNASEYLPLILTEKYDPDTKVAQKYQKLWLDNIGGSTVYSAYQRPLIDYSLKQLEEQKSWEARKMSGQSLDEIFQNTHIESEDYIKECLVCLQSTLDGRYWDGKEAVLKAYLQFLEAHKEFFLMDTQIEDLKSSWQIFVREAQKTNTDYQAHSITYLAEYIENFPPIGPIEEIYTTGIKIVEDSESSEDLYLGAIKLLTSCPLPKESCDLQRLIQALFLESPEKRPIKELICTRMSQAICKALDQKDFSIPIDLFTTMWDYVKGCSEDKVSLSLRKSALALAKPLANWVNHKQTDDEGYTDLMHSIQADIKKLQRNEKNDILRTEWTVLL